MFLFTSIGEKRLKKYHKPVWRVIKNKQGFFLKLFSRSLKVKNHPKILHTHTQKQSLPCPGVYFHKLPLTLNFCMRSAVPRSCRLPVTSDAQHTKAEGAEQLLLTRAIKPSSPSNTFIKSSSF